MLKSVLLVLLTAAPAMAEGLPDFNLDSVRVSDLRGQGGNKQIADGIRKYDMSGAPEPVCTPAGVPLMSEAPGSDFPLYDALPSAVDKAGYISLNSATKLRMNKDKGELTVTFPKVTFGDGGPGDKAHLFVKITRETPVPAISWATVLCSGGQYLGYKGSTVDFPGRNGEFSISETLALGYPGRLVYGTHPWLAGGLASLDELCSPAFLERMKDARAETLPPRLGDFSFEYNSRKNVLKASWAVAR
jgi:hypothetical protein